MEDLISFPMGSTEAEAYLSVPPTGQGPGVLILHAWWGLTSFFREVSDRLAREGFVVLAPDYYYGATARTIDEAKSLRSKLDRKPVNKMIREASTRLLAEPTLSSSKIGVIGFSLGCSFAIELARSKPNDIAGVVLFYGTGGGKLDNVRADFLGHFAEDDQWGAHARKVASLEERLRSAGLNARFHTYPGTVHWFFEEDQPEAYNAEAAKEAWTYTIKFLRGTLR